MIKIIKAETIGQTQLRLTFSDGTQGNYDFAPAHITHGSIVTYKVQPASR